MVSKKFFVDIFIFSFIEDFIFKRFFYSGIIRFFIKYNFCCIVRVVVISGN